MRLRFLFPLHSRALTPRLPLSRLPSHSVALTAVPASLFPSPLLHYSLPCHVDLRSSPSSVPSGVGL